jgi:hypothetical protein
MIFKKLNRRSANENDGPQGGRSGAWVMKRQSTIIEGPSLFDTLETWESFLEEAKALPKNDDMAA